jgi:dynein-related subfamily AAA family protein
MTSSVPTPISSGWGLYLAVASYVRRLCLHSETPGTGKTSAAMALAKAKNATCIVITMSDAQLASDLLGTWISRGNGVVVWNDGPVGHAIRLAQTGAWVVLLLNELDHAGPDALHAAYSLLECGEAGQFTLPSGEVLTIPETLIIVATLNPDPREVLPPAVVNRFEVIIDLGSEVSPMILEALPDSLRSVVADGRMGAREAFSLISLTEKGCDPYVAVQAVLGKERTADYGDALAIALASGTAFSLTPQATETDEDEDEDETDEDEETEDEE